MNRTRIGGMVQCACLIVALMALSSPAAAFGLRGGVLANGGSPAGGSTNGTHVLLGTVGQPAVGMTGGAAHLVCHGFWCFGASRVVGVEDPPIAGGRIPTELAFGVPTPNPSHGSTAFELALSHAARVDLRVFDVLGREVDQLNVERMEAGYHTLHWNAAGATARGTGLYFVRLLVDGRLVGGRRVVVIR